MISEEKTSRSTKDGSTINSTGQQKGAREECTYFNDDGVLVAYRYRNYKAVFCLRMDPFESADIVSDQYDDWRSKNSFLIMQVNCRAIAFLKTFAEYPPSQESQSFTIARAQRDIEVQIKAKAGKQPAKPARRSTARGSLTTFMAARH